MEKNRFVGTWKLASWENHDESGQITYPLGKDAKGFINYSEDGYMFVHIMAGNRRIISSDDLFGIKPDECVDAAASHISYCGEYVIEHDDIIHKVEVCSFPNWIGSDQRRNFEFKDGRLFLSVQGLKVDKGQVTAYLVWEPVNASC